MALPVEPLILGLEVLLSLGGLALLVKRLVFRRAPLSPAATGTDPTQEPSHEETTAAPRALRAWKPGGLEFALFLWVVLMAGFATQLLGSGLLNTLAKPAPEHAKIFGGAFFQIGLLLGCIGFLARSDTGKSFPRPRSGFWKEGCATFLMALPIVYGLGILWQLVLRHFGVEVEQQELIDLLRNARSPGLLALLLFMAAVMAPVTEELIFRGGIFGFLHGRSPRWVALLLSSLFFACLHMNVASFPQLAALGICFALSYERSNNLSVAMLAHALFNLNSVLLVLAGVDF